MIGSLLVILSLLYFTFEQKKGFAESIDFAGGIVLTMKANEVITMEKVREYLAKEKIPASLQKTGKNINNLFKVDIGLQQEMILEKKALEMKEALEKEELSPNSVDYLRFIMARDLAAGDKTAVVFESASHVGPTVGDYLRKSAVKVLILVLVLITIYVAFRFRINYAVGAMVALLHDLFMTMGVIGYFQIQLSIPVIAALLSILGYSINDTIVIFDRIRENVKKTEDPDMKSLIDISINESLSRTILTSFTTVLAIFWVYLYGGEGLEEMSFVLIVGIGIGTYSSSFIASPIVLVWDSVFRKKRK